MQRQFHIEKIKFLVIETEEYDIEWRKHIVRL